MALSWSENPTVYGLRVTTPCLIACSLIIIACGRWRLVFRMNELQNEISSEYYMLIIHLETMQWCNIHRGIIVTVDPELSWCGKYCSLGTN